MDAMRTLPPVGDPVEVEAEVEDLVIKEARRRARQRRLRRGGMVAVVLGMVVAACVPLYARSGETPAAVDLPDALIAGASDVLAVEIPSEHYRTWVFADGRLITMRMYGTFDENGWPNSGFLEQRLTPSGVEMLRSWVISHAGPLVEETLPANERGRDVRVLVGNKLYQRDHTYGSAYWRCHWVGCEDYLANLTNRLPESAWADKEYREYVPTEYRICAHAGLGVQEVPVELVRTALPAEVGRLFAPGAATPSGWGCVHVDPDTARAAQASVVAAGFQEKLYSVQQYLFTIPADNGGEYRGDVMIGAVLPNGDAEEPAG